MVGIKEVGSQRSPMHIFDTISGGYMAQQHSASKIIKDVVDADLEYTTVMLRNIPNKYTRQMLLDQLSNLGFKPDINFLYLPTDFVNRCNVGYCFVNLRSVEARQRFVDEFHNVAAQECLPGFNSYKVCQVSRAKLQGREDNIRRIKSAPEVMAQLAVHPEWLPVIFDDKGNQEIFQLDDCVPKPDTLSQLRRARKGSTTLGQGSRGGINGSRQRMPGTQAAPNSQSDRRRASCPTTNAMHGPNHHPYSNFGEMGVGIHPYASMGMGFGGMMPPHPVMMAPPMPFLPYDPAGYIASAAYNAAAMAPALGMAGYAGFAALDPYAGYGARMPPFNGNPLEEVVEDDADDEFL